MLSTAIFNASGPRALAFHHHRLALPVRVELSLSILAVVGAVAVTPRRTPADAGNTHLGQRSTDPGLSCSHEALCPRRWQPLTDRQSGYGDKPGGACNANLPPRYHCAPSGLKRPGRALKPCRFCLVTTLGMAGRPCESGSPAMPEIAAGRSIAHAVGRRLEGWTGCRGRGWVFIVSGNVYSKHWMLTFGLQRWQLPECAYVLREQSW